MHHKKNPTDQTGSVLHLAAQAAINASAGTSLFVTPTIRFQKYLANNFLSLSGAYSAPIPCMKTYSDVIKGVVSMQGLPIVGQVGQFSLLYNSIRKMRKEFETIFPGSSSSGIEKFRAAGGEILSFFKEILLEGISFEQIEKYMLYTSMEEHIKALRTIYETLIEEQKDRKTYIEQFLYPTVKNSHIDEYFSGYENVFLVMPGALSGIQYKIFAHVAARHGIFIISPHGIEKTRQLSKVFFKEPVSFPNATKYAVPTLTGQSETVIGQIVQDIDKGINPHDILVLNTDEEFSILLSRHLQSIGLPVNFSAGFPVTGHSLYQFFMLMKVCVDNDFYFPYFLDLIQNPYFRYIVSNDDVVFFHRLGTLIIQNNIYKFDPVDKEHLRVLDEAGRENKKLVSNFLFGLELVRKITGSVSGDELLKYMSTLFRKIGNFPVPRFLLFRKECEKGLIELLMLEKAGFEDFSGGAFAPFLSWLSHKKMVELGDIFSGIQIIGLLESWGLEFKTIIVPSANEEIFPASGKMNLFLNSIMRKEMGLPSREDSERLQRWLFANLCKRARVFFYYIKDENGYRGMESPLIYKFGDLTNKEIPLPRIPFVKKHKVIKPIEIKADTRKTIAKMNRTYSDASLEEFRKCGMKFMIHYGLKLEGEIGLSEDADASDIGILVHSVLKSFYKACRFDIPEYKFEPEVLKAIFEYETCTKWVFLSPEKPFIKELLLSRLIKFVKWDFNRLKKKGAIPDIRFFEKTNRLSIEKWHIEGRIDRVDRLTDNSYALYDYKTGKRISKKAITPEGNFEKLQLGIYGLFLKELWEIGRISSLGYLYVRKEVMEDCIISDNVDKYLAEFKAFLLKLLNSIENLDFFSYTADIDYCRYCDFAGICRIEEFRRIKDSAKTTD